MQSSDLLKNLVDENVFSETSINDTDIEMIEASDLVETNESTVPSTMNLPNNHKTSIATSTNDAASEDDNVTLAKSSTVSSTDLLVDNQPVVDDVFTSISTANCVVTANDHNHQQIEVTPSSASTDPSPEQVNFTTPLAALPFESMSPSTVSTAAFLVPLDHHQPAMSVDHHHQPTTTAVVDATVVLSSSNDPNLSSALPVSSDNHPTAVFGNQQQPISDSSTTLTADQLSVLACMSSSLTTASMSIGQLVLKDDSFASLKQESPLVDCLPVSSSTDNTTTNDAVMPPVSAAAATTSDYHPPLEPSVDAMSQVLDIASNHQPAVDVSTSLMTSSTSTLPLTTSLQSICGSNLDSVVLVGSDGLTAATVQSTPFVQASCDNAASIALSTSLAAAAFQLPTPQLEVSAPSYSTDQQQLIGALPIIVSSSSSSTSTINQPSAAVNTGPGQTGNRSAGQPRTPSASKLSTASSSGPYKCPDCDKQFRILRYLEKHRRIHTGEKPYQCCFCGRLFNDWPNMNRHKRIHTGERPYRCQICSKTFSQPAVYNEHVKRHTGERPYICTICAKGFPRAARLTVHMRVHTGERPYPCTSCERRFSQPHHLAAHLRVHSGDRPYHCDLCHLTFACISNLRRHRKQVHPNSSPLPTDIDQLAKKTPSSSSSTAPTIADIKPLLASASSSSRSTTVVQRQINPAPQLITSGGSSTNDQAVLAAAAAAMSAGHVLTTSGALVPASSIPGLLLTSNGTLIAATGPGSFDQQLGQLQPTTLFAAPQQQAAASTNSTQQPQTLSFVLPAGSLLGGGSSANQQQSIVVNADQLRGSGQQIAFITAAPSSVDGSGQLDASTAGGGILVNSLSGETVYLEPLDPRLGFDPNQFTLASLPTSQLHTSTLTGQPTAQANSLLSQQQSIPSSIAFNPNSTGLFAPQQQQAIYQSTPTIQSAATASLFHPPSNPVQTPILQQQATSNPASASSSSSNQQQLIQQQYQQQPSNQSRPSSTPSGPPTAATMLLPIVSHTPPGDPSVPQPDPQWSSPQVNFVTLAPSSSSCEGVQQSPATTAGPHSPLHAVEDTNSL